MKKALMQVALYAMLISKKSLANRELWRWKQMKYLVLLAGCGLGDGSCIEEVILTYAALDKYGCDYTPVAENVSFQSVNHLTEQMAEKRNILIEAARVGGDALKIFMRLILQNMMHWSYPVELVYWTIIETPMW